MKPLAAHEVQLPGISMSSVPWVGVSADGSEKLCVEKAWEQQE